MTVGSTQVTPCYKRCRPVTVAVTGLGVVALALLGAGCGGSGEAAPTEVVLVTHDVDEALRLADRVLVLSDRPARVLDALSVPAPRPRTLERMTEPDFATMKRKVLQRLGALTR